MSMNYQQLRAVVQEQYEPLHPHLYELRDEFLVPSLVEAVHAGTAEDVRGTVQSIRYRVQTRLPRRPSRAD